MSPVSRGRRKKRPTTRPRGARRVMPGLAGVHAELLGAFRPVVQATDPLSQLFSLVAVAFATMNVVGGYVVTDRMLQMFKRKPTAAPKAEQGEG